MFDYAKAMRMLIEDIVSQCESLSHIDMASVLVGCIRARKSGSTGLYARTIPLRFENGSLTTVRRGYVYRVPRVVNEGVEVLYIVSFCLPRFQDLSFDDKITTIFHELYHISPIFDGDIRRFGGANYVHTSSQKNYDELMSKLSHEYLGAQPRPQLHDFLKLSFEELSCKHDGVTITIYRAPKPELVRPDATLPATAKKRRKGKPK